ncbi:hypothetical protein F1654_05020 [Alkalicaulis satelles]|uniref:Uncharacterized protein n=1 Tax=Alkalicaulis satelles TaxID=2609175 RepID=A0A5M6ZKJ5_9PROT|nr:hypothetical protein [Alkalicaulis satelles]KAA5805343.1 hypothetical protein F1654_05020 [Alkalicaulis satelles]
MRPSPDTIAVRAFTEKPKTGEKARRGRKKSGLDEPSAYTLVFDTETTIDAAQALRVGAYQVRKGEVLAEEGLFYLAETLSRGELDTLKAYCVRHGLRLRTVRDFNENVLLEIGYHGQGLIAGFNLPFDLSRIAIRHAPARFAMRGGFSFMMAAGKHQPEVRVKHLSPRASLIDFNRPAGQDTPRGARKRGQKTPAFRGYFVDLKTLAAALTSRSFKLETLCAFLKTPTRKHASEEHGETLSDTYLDYARVDVQVSWECLCALRARYREHGLRKPIHRILSEASIGKAYLTLMGISPLMECQTVPRRVFAMAMETYYGGRAEIRMRRVPVEVIYTDFKSMYPTVNALMGLWEFIIGDGLNWHDATAQTRAFLGSVTREAFQSKETWRHLRTLVRVKPDGDLLPVRAVYDAAKKTRVNAIGLNFLTYDGGLWYTLADVVAAKILSGKTPDILEAVSFVPGEPQLGLKSVNLFGKPEFAIDPLHDDAFVRLIDLRDEAKAQGDDVEKAIKIIANSTSYGIFIEILRDEAPKPETLKLFHPDGREDTIKTKALEEPGTFFNPVIGTLITGAARLMLALAERTVIAEGLQWAFCDTDSLAIARPEGMGRDEFRTRVGRVVDWFDPLNPYAKPGSILQIEAENYASDGSGALEPLYAFAISAKRYALFNFDSESRPVIRKASAHGLGHLVAPYGDDEPAPDIPDPVLPLGKIGVSRWQYDFWYKIIEAGLGDAPKTVTLDYHPALQKPAATRYAATSPALLKWMERWNAPRRWHDKVRAHGFMLKFTPRSHNQMAFDEDDIVMSARKGRPSWPPVPKPSAPFDCDPAKAAEHAFDRETGEPVPVHMLETYVEALALFHLSPEAKFENGDYDETGETRRRHIIAKRVKRIGKEANAVAGDGVDYPVRKGDEAEFG